MMRREYVTYEYSSDYGDTANRRKGNTKANVLVLSFSDAQTLTIAGDKARFTHLRNMLDQLLNDWTD